MQGFSDPHLMWSTELLKLTLEMECGVAQTLRQTWSYSDSCWMGCRVTQTRVECGFTQARV